MKYLILILMLTGCSDPEQVVMVTDDDDRLFTLSIEGEEVGEPITYDTHVIKKPSSNCVVSDTFEKNNTFSSNGCAEFGCIKFSSNYYDMALPELSETYTSYNDSNKPKLINEIVATNDEQRIIEISIATKRALDWINETMPKYTTREYPSWTRAVSSFGVPVAVSKFSVPIRKSYRVAKNYDMNSVLYFVNNKEF